MKRFSYSKIRKDGFKAQGYTVIENKYTLISSYKKNNRSRIYVYSASTGEYVYTIILDIKSHAGGITYDDRKKILFVTGSSGKIYAYDFNKIRGMMKSKEPILDTSMLRIKGEISLEDYTFKNAATISYFENALYASTFGLKSRLYKIDYNIDASRTILVVESIQKLTNIGLAVQGFSFYLDDSLYLLTSTSCGFRFKSRLNLYKVKKRLKHINTINLKHPGIEGIYVDKKGMISGIFEFQKQESFMIDINTLKEIAKSYHPLNKFNIWVSTLFFEISRLKHHISNK